MNPFLVVGKLLSDLYPDILCELYQLVDLVPKQCV